MRLNFSRRAIMLYTIAGSLVCVVVAVVALRNGLVNEGPVPYGGFRKFTLVSSIDSTAIVVTAAISYAGVTGFFAYRRNPLRGARKRIRSQPVAAGFKAHDVSIRAKRDRNVAVVRFLVQTAGVGVAVNGAYPYLITHWYVYVIIGSTVTWGGGRFIHPAGLRREPRRGIPASGSLRAASMLAAAFVTVILGLALLVVYDRMDVTGNASAQKRVDNYTLIGYALVAVGAIGARYGRRLRSVEATRLMLRDTRPPVLYLRSFGDDTLKLWTATLGRRSLIERFTPGRFDAFEEVLTRHLSLLGPVVAVNPPGTKLSPLGAARETLDPTDWQSTIATWMQRSSLIVFVAPPGRVSQGLLWELGSVSANRHWDKTLVVVPPVSPEQLDDRWRAFLGACGRLWPFTFPLPRDDPRALVLSFRHNQWALITADRRTEWSYGGALKHARDDAEANAG